MITAPATMLAAPEVSTVFFMRIRLQVHLPERSTALMTSRVFIPELNFLPMRIRQQKNRKNHFFQCYAGFMLLCGMGGLWITPICSIAKL
jgi:Na+/citrate or Na+/malate symporter